MANYHQNYGAHTSIREANFGLSVWGDHEQIQIANLHLKSFDFILFAFQCPKVIRLVV